MAPAPVPSTTPDPRRVDPDHVPSDEPKQPANEPLVEADLLIEDVSIDGMCGVY